MKRREFVKMTTVAATAVAAGVTDAQETAESNNAPHVVYVFSDTHRWCSMSFTETPAVHTSAMAAMKTNGVSFSNCYSTLPICSPHRAILMTGRWPWQQGFIANHMALEHRPDMDTLERATLPWMFRDAGYRTYYAGKWHLGGPQRSTECGIDAAAIWSSEDHTVTDYRAFGEGRTLFGKGPKTWQQDPRYTGAGGDTSFPYKIIGETDQALLMMDEHFTKHQEQPMFLMLSLHDPHGPFQKNGKPTHPPHILEFYRNRPPIPFRKNVVHKSSDWYADYHASITAVDEQLVRVRAKLRDLGIADNTILVYSSDHGGMGGAQGVGGGGKRWPHDESSRVPFLVEWPGGISVKDRTVEALFSSIDIFPTVCSLAKLPERLKVHGAKESAAYLRACPGIDHAANVTGKPEGPDPDSVFVCHPSNMNMKNPASPVHRTVITKEFMYSVKGKTRLGKRDHWKGWDPDREKEWCLYDRVNDPLQMTNLIDDPKFETEKAKLRAELATWLAKAETPFVETWFAKHPHAEHWREEHNSSGIEDAFNLSRAIQ